MTSSCSDHGLIMLGSWSNRSRIVNDVANVFGKFLFDLGVLFCAAGATFGNVGGIGLDLLVHAL